MRQRLAPSAARIPISRPRTVARTSMRLATLAHAISMTSVTAPSSISIQDHTCAVSASCHGIT